MRDRVKDHVALPVQETLQQGRTFATIKENARTERKSVAETGVGWCKTEAKKTIEKGSTSKERLSEWRYRKKDWESIMGWSIDYGREPRRPVRQE